MASFRSFFVISKHARHHLNGYHFVFGENTTSLSPDTHYGYGGLRTLYQGTNLMDLSRYVML